MRPTATEYVARPYAQIACEFMLRDGYPRTALFAPPGMGKTVMSYTVLAARQLAGLTERPTLVLGPKRVARDVWPDEVGKWTFLAGLPVVPVTGTEQQRLQALKRDAAVYTTNYENIPWLVKTLGDRWPFETVIADESTKLKSFRTRQGGVRAAALSKVAAKPAYWVNLTGTPSPNGLQDLWGQTWFLDFGKRLGNTYSAFMERWFTTDMYTREVKPHKHADREIHEKLADICLSLNPADWFDLRDPVVTAIPVKLPGAAMKAYKQMETQMFLELAAHELEVEAVNSAASLQKCMQIANGGIITEQGYKPVHDAKFEALTELLLEFEHAPVLVAYQYIGERERLLKELHGAVSLADAEGMAAFKAGKAKVGLVHGRSVGHGVDGLQRVTNVLIRFGHDWNMEERLQLVDRIGPVRQAQAGLDRPTLVYDLVATDTVDEDILIRHASKRKVQDVLMDAMHHRNKP